MPITRRFVNALPSSHQCRCASITLMLFVGLSLLPVASKAAQVDSPPTTAVPELLVQLDADNYQVREAAADQLVRQGVSSLKPMVLHSLSSSPESVWRIRSIIEKIGIAGDEGTFYKSTGVLRLLYPLNDAGTTSRLENLRQQWTLTRKKNAIKRLQELGAKISDPLGDQLSVAPQFWGGPQVVLNGRLFIDGRPAGGDTLSVKSDSAQAQASIRKRKSLTDRELIEQVDELLASDLATNRERILGTDDDTDTEKVANLASPLQGEQRFAVNALRISQLRTGATAILDANFRGSIDDLKSLQAIPNLTIVHWKDRQLDASEMKMAHKSASISRVHIENCKFPNEPLPELAWPRLATHYEFVNQTIPVSAIKRLRTSVINSLKLSKCAASETLHQHLRQIDSLSVLALEDIPIDEQWFESFASIGSLTQISLSACKFDRDAYRELKTSRPKLRVDFTPHAFLGIRSPDFGNANLERARMLARMRAAQKANPDQQQDAPAFDLPVELAGCSISDVVGGSGAEKAGLKPGDVIMKIDGEPVTIFEDIRLIIAQHRAGDKLEVEFTRDEQTNTATIELSRLDENVIR